MLYILSKIHLVMNHEAGGLIVPALADEVGYAARQKHADHAGANGGSWRSPSGSSWCFPFDSRGQFSHS
jgi:hypothetical protein